MPPSFTMRAFFYATLVGIDGSRQYAVGRQKRLARYGDTVGGLPPGAASKVSTSRSRIGSECSITRHTSA